MIRMVDRVRIQVLREAGLTLQEVADERVEALVRALLAGFEAFGGVPRRSAARSRPSV